MRDDNDDNDSEAIDLLHQRIQDHADRRYWQAHCRWVPATQVHVGDRLVFLLSDGGAAATITGWQDRRLDLTRHGLPIAYQRTYTVTGAPWWARDEAMRRFDVNGSVLIATEGA
jgi:hypothetical protein